MNIYDIFKYKYFICTYSIVFSYKIKKIWVISGKVQLLLTYHQNLPLMSWANLIKLKLLLSEQPSYISNYKNKIGVKLQDVSHKWKMTYWEYWKVFSQMTFSGYLGQQNRKELMWCSLNERRQKWNVIYFVVGEKKWRQVTISFIERYCSDGGREEMNYGKEKAIKLHRK